MSKLFYDHERLKQGSCMVIKDPIFTTETLMKIYLSSGEITEML